MIVWIETKQGLTVFEGARGAYQKNKLVHVITHRGEEKVLDGTLKRCIPTTGTTLCYR